MFASPVLTQPVHLSGTSKIKIRLACSKPAANLSVWMVSLPWTNSNKLNDNLITRGWADPQNYKSLTESEPLVPGQFYELSFELEPDDQIIPGRTANRTDDFFQRPRFHALAGTGNGTYDRSGSDDDRDPGCRRCPSLSGRNRK